MPLLIPKLSSVRILEIHFFFNDVSNSLTIFQAVRQPEPGAYFFSTGVRPLGWKCPFGQPNGCFWLGSGVGSWLDLKGWWWWWWWCHEQPRPQQSNIPCRKLAFLFVYICCFCDMVCFTVSFVYLWVWEKSEGVGTILREADFEAGIYWGVLWGMTSVREWRKDRA